MSQTPSENLGLGKLEKINQDLLNAIKQINAGHEVNVQELLNEEDGKNEIFGKLSSFSDKNLEEFKQLKEEINNNVIRLKLKDMESRFESIARDSSTNLESLRQLRLELTEFGHIVNKINPEIAIRQNQRATNLRLLVNKEYEFRTILQKMPTQPTLKQAQEIRSELEAFRGTIDASAEDDYLSQLLARVETKISYVDKVIAILERNVKISAGLKQVIDANTAAYNAKEQKREQRQASAHEEQDNVVRVDAELTGLGSELTEELSGTLDPIEAAAINNEPAFAAYKEQLKAQLQGDYDKLSPELQGALEETLKQAKGAIDAAEFNSAQNLQEQKESLTNGEAVQNFNTVKEEKTQQERSFYQHKQELIKSLKDPSSDKTLGYAAGNYLPQAYTQIKEQLQNTLFSPSQNLDAQQNALSKVVELYNAVSTDVIRRLGVIVNLTGSMPLFHQNIQKNCGEYLGESLSGIPETVEEGDALIAQLEDMKRSLDDKISSLSANTQVCPDLESDDNKQTILDAMNEAIEAVQLGDSSAEKKARLTAISEKFSEAKTPEEKRVYLALFIQVAGAQRKMLPSIFQSGQTHSLSAFISGLGDLYKNNDEVQAFINGKGIAQAGATHEQGY